MGNRVRLEFEDDVAIIVIDNPPINAGSHAVRRGLVEAVEQAAARPDTKTVVVMGAGKTFVAGSDIREFGAPIESPSLPDVIATIEDCRVPVVAAIHGAANRGANDVIEYLAANGARLDVADEQGRTPIDWAKGVFLATHPPVRKPDTIALLERLSTQRKAVATAR